MNTIIETLLHNPHMVFSIHRIMRVIDQHTASKKWLPSITHEIDIEDDSKYIYIITIRDGERYTKWYNNGNELVWWGLIDGKQQSYKHWYKNGQLRLECNLINGKKSGPYKHWYKNGQLRLECEYVDGKIIIPYGVWNRRGNLLYEILQ